MFLLDTTFSAITLFILWSDLLFVPVGQDVFPAGVAGMENPLGWPLKAVNHVRFCLHPSFNKVKELIQDIDAHRWVPLSLEKVQSVSIL